MSTRADFRATLEDFATKAKATLPEESTGRIDSAVKLVLANDVELHEDGTATVGSRTNPAKTYAGVNGACPCVDFPRAPDGWCSHRIARALWLRTDRALREALDTEACRELTEGADHNDALDSEASGACVETPGAHDTNLTADNTKLGRLQIPLPEARASVNVRLAILGHDCQVTLRDHDEGALLTRLETLLRRYPVATPAQASTAQTHAAAPTPQTPVCDWHGALKESTKAPGTWFCPARMANGSYCQSRWPVKGGARG